MPRYSICIDKLIPNKNYNRVEQSMEKHYAASVRFSQVSRCRPISRHFPGWHCITASHCCLSLKITWHGLIQGRSNEARCSAWPGHKSSRPSNVDVDVGRYNWLSAARCVYTYKFKVYGTDPEVNLKYSGRLRRRRGKLSRRAFDLKRQSQRRRTACRLTWLPIERQGRDKKDRFDVSDHRRVSFLKLIDLASSRWIRDPPSGASKLGKPYLMSSIPSGTTNNETG